MKMEFCPRCKRLLDFDPHLSRSYCTSSNCDYRTEKKEEKKEDGVKSGWCVYYDVQTNKYYCSRNKEHIDQSNPYLIAVAFTEENALEIVNLYNDHG